MLLIRNCRFLGNGMDNMDYSVEYKLGHIEMPRFQRKYQDREKFMAFCQECPRFNSVWSCPPLSFAVDKFLSRYAWINLLCAKINLDGNIIQAADTKEKIKTIGWDIVSTVKIGIDEQLRKLEAQIPGSVSLSSGGCILCDSCTRKEGLPCRQPDKIRYSFDAFGFDLTAITKDVFQIEILWSKDSLPEYFTLIHALLTNEPVAPVLFESVGLKSQ